MPQMSRLSFVLLTLIVAVLVGGCDLPPRHADENTGRMAVVATIFPLSDLVHNLGGEKVAASCLLQPRSSPHNFEPDLEQAKKTARASLFVYMGGGLDDWAVKTARAAGRINLLNLYEKALEHGWRPPEEPFLEGSQKNDLNRQFNPHLWLDPLTVRDYLCPALTAALVEADRKNEAYYRSSLAAYQAKLTALDRAIQAELSDLPHKSFVSVHAAWHYFAARYDLRVAVISDFHGQEPSAAGLSRLLDLCCENRIRVVSVEPQLSSDIAGMIAREIGGQVILLDPLGGAGLDRRDSYLDLMLYNTAVLKDVFSKQ